MEKGEQMRLIDADKLRLSYWVSPTSTVSTAGQYYFYSQDEVDNAPTIDAEPVRHGKWIRHRESLVYVIECSVCGQKYFNPVMQSPGIYCSNCGAKNGRGKEE